MKKLMETLAFAAVIGLATARIAGLTGELARLREGRRGEQQ